MLKIYNEWIQEVLWQDIREAFYEDEPLLAALIDELSPDASFPLIQVHYPFGSMIHENRQVQLPVASHHTVALAQAHLPVSLKNQLHYSSLPLGFICGSHGVEIYREMEDRIHSIAFFSKGLHLGLWEMFDMPTPYSISAGARTIQMLPKISAATQHLRLKTRGVTSLPPKTSLQHYQIFRELARHETFPTPWFCNVIYFTKPWIEKMTHDRKWLPLKHFMLTRAWEHTDYNRNRFIYDSLWNSFSKDLSNLKIRPASYIMDAFKNLIYIALGLKSLTAYRPANGSDEAGPTDTLMQYYFDVYNLKKIIPTIMIPQHLMLDNFTTPIYNSLRIPTYLNTVPYSRDSVSIKQDMNDLIWVLAKFERNTRAGLLMIDDPKIFTLFDQISFDFFHSDVTSSDEVIQSTHLMPQGDKNLVYLPKMADKNMDYSFAAKSTFVRGCIRLSPKQLSTER